MTVSDPALPDRLNRAQPPGFRGTYTTCVVWAPHAAQLLPVQAGSFALDAHARGSKLIDRVKLAARDRGAPRKQNHMKHSWNDLEMIQTLNIADMPPDQRAAPIAALTASIQQSSDPNMDASRVTVAVRAAINLRNGTPDAKYRASLRLRELQALGF